MIVHLERFTKYVIPICHVIVKEIYVIPLCHVIVEEIQSGEHFIHDHMKSISREILVRANVNKFTLIKFSKLFY